MGNTGNEMSREIIKHMYARLFTPSEDEYFRQAMSYAGVSGYGRSRIMEVRKSTVTDVNVIVPDKVVEVTFADGSKQKTVCADSDIFSLEQAISICITKNLIGGTSHYNKAVNDGIKVYEKKVAKAEADKVEEERIKAKRAKVAAKRAERIARRKAKEIEEQIEIQKEAIIRANKEIAK